MFNRYDELYLKKTYNTHDYHFEFGHTQKEQAQESLLEELAQIESNAIRTKLKKTNSGENLIKQSAAALMLSRLSGNTKNIALEYLGNVFDKLS